MENFETIYYDFIAYMFRCSTMAVFKARKREIYHQNITEGRPKIFHEEDREIVFKWISKKTKLMCPPDRSELKNKVQEIIEKKGHNIIISRNWFDGFIDQNFDKI